MCLKLTADWSVSLLAMIRSWPLFTVNLIFLIIKVTSQVSVLQSLGNVAEADCWMVSKFTGYGQGPVSKCISCDQVLGHCLLRGLWTCRQLKKNMPPLRLKTEVFMAQMEHQQMWWKPQRKQIKERTCFCSQLLEIWAQIDCCSHIKNKGDWRHICEMVTL